MKITPKYQNRIISLPYESVFDILPTASQDELKVLIAVFAEPEFDIKELSSKIDITENSIRRALKSLVSKGLVDIQDSKGASSVKKTEPADRKNEQKQMNTIMLSESSGYYTPEELAKIMDSHPSYKDLLNSCQQLLGKIFNVNDNTLFIHLMHQYGLPEDYMLMLCSHAAEKKNRSLRYIEKLARDFYERDIVTSEALEAEFKRLEELHSFESFIRTTFGLGARQLTSKEKEYVEKWHSDYSVSEDMMTYAYETTIKNIKSPSFEYTNAILEKWHVNGYDTIEKVKKAEQEFKAKKNTRGNPSKSFNTSDFYEAALSRSYSSKKTGDSK